MASILIVEDETAINELVKRNQANTNPRRKSWRKNMMSFTAALKQLIISDRDTRRRILPVSTVTRPSVLKSMAKTAKLRLCPFPGMTRC